MSVGTDGKQIRCDGEDCQAVASLPVALRRQLNSMPPSLPTTEGWLFITGNSGGRHFCPHCAPKQLTHIVLAVRSEQTS